ncbi:MAG TPA: hypothetical protein VFW11_15005, partial [Cyclobacteriaceae bacterium]|nr:hypothetical protein [Cyclobacteriaceae bacterium]
RSPETYEWFSNEWLNLAVIEPDTKMIYVFKDGNFQAYDPLKKSVNAVDNLNTLFETHHDNLPVYVFHDNGKGESHEHEPAA